MAIWLAKKRLEGWMGGRAALPLVPSPDQQRGAGKARHCAVQRVPSEQLVGGGRGDVEGDLERTLQVGGGGVGSTKGNEMGAVRI